MRKKLFIIAATAALGAAFLAGQTGMLSSAPTENASISAKRFSPYGAQKAVYQLNRSGGWFDREFKRQLSVAQNHMSAVGPGKLDLRIVLSGEGILLLKDAKGNAQLAGLVDKLKAQGARFMICANTLNSMNLDPMRDLHDVAPGDIVQAGIAEVAALEQQGFVYLQP